MTSFRRSKTASPSAKIQTKITDWLVTKKHAQSLASVQRNAGASSSSLESVLEKLPDQHQLAESIPSLVHGCCRIIKLKPRPELWFWPRHYYVASLLWGNKKQRWCFKQWVRRASSRDVMMVFECITTIAHKKKIL